MEREKVAAGCEGLAFVAILYTGVKDNEYGLSLAQRRALFVGIMNSIDKGIQSFSVLQHPSPWVDYALCTIGAWGGDNGYAGNVCVCGVLAHWNIT